MDAEAMFTALESLGLDFSRRTSTRGVPYGAFRLVGSETDVDTAITAIYEHDVLRLTSHDIETSADPLELVRRGARLPLGAAYRSPEQGSAELSVAAFVGNAAVLQSVLGPLIQYVVQSTTWLSRHGDAMAPTLPAFDGATRARPDIRGVLSEHGHRVTREGDGHRVVISAGGVGFSIFLRHQRTGWISAVASYTPEQELPSGETALITLQKLQRWASAGRFVVDDARKVRAEVPTPVLEEQTSRSVEWTASQCAALLQTAAKHFGFAGQH